MYTLGYRFRPWRGEEALADGESILDYLRDTAREYGVDRHIRYGHHVVRADWDSSTARWTVTVRWSTGSERTTDRQLPVGVQRLLRLRRGLHARVRGPERFARPGRSTRSTGPRTSTTRTSASSSSAPARRPSPWCPPWPRAVPRTSRCCSAHRRTSSRCRPATASPRGRRKVLGPRASYAVTRWKNITSPPRSSASAGAAPRTSSAASSARTNIAQLLPGYAVDTHFKPTYDPWDQRLCLVPDGDLFRAISDGSASWSPTGSPPSPRPASSWSPGRPSTPTSSSPRPASTCGSSAAPRSRSTASRIEPGKTMAYRAMMLSGVPNFAFTIGYTNASWTLKADLVSEYVVRLLAHMRVAAARAASSPCGTRDGRRGAADGLRRRLHPAGGPHPPPPGHAGPVVAQAELPPRRPVDPPRASTTGCCAGPERTLSGSALTFHGTHSAATVDSSM